MRDHLVVHVIPAITALDVGVIVTGIWAAASVAYDSIERIYRPILTGAHTGLQRQAFIVSDMMADLSAQRRESLKVHGEDIRTVMQSEVLFGNHRLLAPVKIVHSDTPIENRID
jgi:hypothetical protein